MSPIIWNLLLSFDDTSTLCPARMNNASTHKKKAIIIAHSNKLLTYSVLLLLLMIKKQGLTKGSWLFLKQLFIKKNRNDNKQLPALCKANEKASLTIYNKNITVWFQKSTYDTHYKSTWLIISQLVQGTPVQINPPQQPQSYKKDHRSHTDRSRVSNHTQFVVVVDGTLR